MTAGKGVAGCEPLVADKWSMVVIARLQRGPQRFSQLTRDIPGISKRVLTVTLRGLERDGLLTRTVHNVMPPHVSYELTPMGNGLVDAMAPWRDWKMSHLPRIAQARLDFDSRDN